MSSCTPITNLSLDNESKAALERIKQKQNLAKLLGAAISAGVFNSIFTIGKYDHKHVQFWTGMKYGGR